MKREDILKAIAELPKVETNNPISAMNSININDLMNAVDRLNKIPDYNDLLKENQKLKKQVEEYKKLGFKYLQDKNNNLETQQKEFIKYLEDEIQQKREKSTTLTAFIRNVVPLQQCLQKYKSIIGVSNETNIK